MLVIFMFVYFNVYPYSLEGVPYWPPLPFSLRHGFLSDSEDIERKRVNMHAVCTKNNNLEFRITITKLPINDVHID